jgi:DmsE family decaheme c-type cytochrome
MPSRINPTVLILCGLALWLAALVSTSTRDVFAAPAPTSSPAQAQPAAADFAGEATCLTCHEDKAYKTTAHGRAFNARTPAAKQGCESCHGAGKAHAESGDPERIRRFDAISAAEASEACTSCHNRGPHALWDGSQHESRDLTCATCHSVHASKSDVAQLKARTEQDVCATCHRDKIAKLDRSGHMPVREGKMQCSTCHDPHGSTNVRLLTRGDSVGEFCSSCHADKRGPYLWEHAPVRDGCPTCHDPHGSSNERMLVSKPPILCQRCHIATRHPSTIYDAGAIGSQTISPSIRIYARSCVTCHSAIHGSNHPSGQRFVR